MPGPTGRSALLQEYIDASRINVTHIYLAQLMDQGYADYVLTVNFDDLMLRALALFNRFPPVYDMAIFKDLTTTTFKEQSVIHLHGQHHGLWLLNTAEEMAKVKQTIPPILHKISHQRIWVFIGYSGQDPVFEQIKNLGRFDNGLYWVTYRDNDPPRPVCEGLFERPNTHAFLIKGFDADTFMLKLNTALALPQPAIVDAPFSLLQRMLENIVDIDDQDHYQGVKQRLVIAKDQVSQAIRQFERGEIDSSESSQEKSHIDLLKKEIIDLILNEDFEAGHINWIVTKAGQYNDPDLNSLLAWFYLGWGNYYVNQAKTTSGAEAEALYRKACEKYRQAVDIKPDNHAAFNNWGVTLGDLAKTKTCAEAEALYQQACDKFRRTVDIKPDDHAAFYNWGYALSDLAKTKTCAEAEALYRQACEKYRQAVDIKPDDHEALYNWGNALSNLAKTASGDEVEALNLQAIEKYQKSIALGGRCYNLACLYALRRDKEQALQYLRRSLESREVSAAWVLADADWQAFSGDADFIQLVSRYAAGGSGGEGLD